GMRPLKRSANRAAWVLMLLSAPAAQPESPVRFAEHTVATGLTGGYQVVAVDLNHDGKPDLIALASGMTELVWFENPSWQRHVIAANLSGMINLAAWDIDGDGIPEIVLASGFAMDAKKSTGIVSVLRHNGDPRQPWTIREIDHLPTSHRLRWADIDGSGRKVVVNQPLTAATAGHPEDRAHTPLVFYRPGAWKRETISEQDEGVVHGIYPVDWDGDGRDAILTASFVGIHLYKLGMGGGWTRTEIAAGDPAPWPKSGSSDVAVGRLGKQRFLAAVEPWHGNQVVIYRENAGRWQRQVIDDTLSDGHTIWTADLNGDGRDEVIAGYRGKGVKVYYALDAQGAHWSSTVLDASIAAAACAIADLNGDGRPDIACIGSATANLKWYENLGPLR
ncbi:MAG TPA: VCBS repeat-containing protein, partial [Bryobacteraceae bacterium]|nr:VCBS repeat-containing protein [Bryobacteraceae bacterium]